MIEEEEEEESDGGIGNRGPKEQKMDLGGSLCWWCAAIVEEEEEDSLHAVDTASAPHLKRLCRLFMTVARSVVSASLFSLTDAMHAPATMAGTLEIQSLPTSSLAK